MNRYAREREAKFRGGVRILLSAGVIATTWFIASLALFVSSGTWLGHHSVSQQDVALRWLVALLTGAAAILIVTLLGEARWRWIASGAWAITLVVTATWIGLPSTTGSTGNFTFGLAALGIAGSYAWTLLKFDPPPS